MSIEIAEYKVSRIYGTSIVVEGEMKDVKSSNSQQKCVNYVDFVHGVFLVNGSDYSESSEKAQR